MSPISQRGKLLLMFIQVIHRPVKLIACAVLACALVGCGGNAHEFNDKLVELGSRPKQDMAQLSLLLKSFDGSEGQVKAIDAAHAKVLETVAAAKADITSLEVPSSLEDAEAMVAAFKTYMTDVESMLANEWGEAVKVIQKTSGAQGAALADLHSKLRLLASQLQTKARAADLAMESAQAAFAKANEIRLAK